jgi:hypothetical protein
MFLLLQEETDMFFSKPLKRRDGGHVLMKGRLHVEQSYTATITCPSKAETLQVKRPTGSKCSLIS